MRGIELGKQILSKQKYEFVDFTETEDKSGSGGYLDRHPEDRRRTFKTRSAIEGIFMCSNRI
jgi:hypothetical protein